MKTPINSINEQSEALVQMQSSIQNLMLLMVVAISHSEKLANFSRQNFKTWQQKMLFYLTMLNLAKFLKDDPPTVKEGEVDKVTTFTAVEALKHFDFLYGNYILNGFSNALYKVYSVKKTAKELWTSLDHKYKVKDAGTKKFLVAKFLKFVIIDSKLVLNQVQELQLIIHRILVERMMISESFEVEVIIEKLPLALNNIKNYLMHKRKEMSVEDLTIRLQIEEDNRGDVSNKQKFQGKCFNYNKMGQKSSYCRIPKKIRANEADVVEEISKEVSNMDYVPKIRKNYE
ncbi:hypothetical protein PVK06_048370 [Gossypium arboreum]|uniref:Uncharacterized protein n=1 Tax=Gossypium arboreum TaxID=29729 RepID=A0ABR0MHR5_GOSAR|nr:hypothetical protein PVK06_048370 [Gossypium arboreum]